MSDAMTLYTLFARDLFGFVAPGAFVCLVLIYRLSSSPKDLFAQMTKAPRAALVPIIVCFYLVGLALQGMGFDLIGG